MKNKQKERVSSLLWILLLVISGIYLLNPTAGVLELIPDNLPIYKRK